MTYEFKPSFDRSVKLIPAETKREVKELCITFTPQKIMGENQSNKNSFGQTNKKKNLKNDRRRTGVNY
jgi:hypothetical protein